MSDNKINRHCLVCGKGYHACDSCMEQKSFTPWRTLTDTSKHFQIYMILSQYNGKCISKEDAKEQLSHHNSQEFNSFLPKIKKTIDEIMDEPKKISSRNFKKNESKQISEINNSEASAEIETE